LVGWLLVDLVSVCLFSHLSVLLCVTFVIL
jgi:hypothetical protein